MAAIGVQQLHGRAACRLAIDDEAVRADAAVALAHGPGEPRAIDVSLDLPFVGQQEVVAERMCLDHAGPSHLRQNASRCQPNRRTSGRGSALKGPTKNVWNTAPSQPPCRRDFTGKRSSTIRTSRNPRNMARNSPALYFFSTGASSCSRGTFISFDN